jgi:hypothetical protein
MSTPQVAPAGAVAPPQDMAGDMKFVGLFMIIIGALECLTITGALVGIPLIFAGLRARESGDAYLAYAQGDYSALGRAFIGQASYFKIIKILMIIGLVLGALGIIAVIGLIATVGLSGILNH